MFYAVESCLAEEKLGEGGEVLGHMWDKWLYM